MQGLRSLRPHVIRRKECRPTARSLHTSVLSKAWCEPRARRCCRAGPRDDGLGRQVPSAGRLELGPRRAVPRAAARGRADTAAWNFALCPLARSVSARRGGKSDGLLPAAASYCRRSSARAGPLTWRRTTRPRSSSDSPTDRYRKAGSRPGGGRTASSFWRGKGPEPGRCSRPVPRGGGRARAVCACASWAAAGGAGRRSPG